MTNGTVNEGKVDILSVLLTLATVSKDNFRDGVVANAFWAAAPICAAGYAATCTAAGGK